VWSHEIAAEAQWLDRLEATAAKPADRAGQPVAVDVSAARAA